MITSKVVRNETNTNNLLVLTRMLLNPYTFSSVFFKAGMHKIRPAGEMWPVEAFYLTHKAQMSSIQLVCLNKHPLNGWNTLILALEYAKVRLRFELCTPAYKA